MSFKSHFLLAACASISLAAAAPATYGRPLKLKEETKISQLFATPEKFNGKEVRIRGTIIQVCAKRGCFMQIKSDEKFQQIMVKVEDGVIVFPADGAGREAVVEGVVKARVYTEADQKALCDTERAALFGKAAKGPAGPRTVVRIEGLGAEI